MGTSRNERRASVRPQPLLAVRDVVASSRFYCELLDGESTSVTVKSDHADLYDRICVGSELVLQLHAWDAEDHPNLVDADRAPPGHGVLVWFELDDFDASVARAKVLGAEIIEGPITNPRPGHRELWLRDPDGYVVVVCSPDGEAA